MNFFLWSSEKIKSILLNLIGSCFFELPLEYFFNVYSYSLHSSEKSIAKPPGRFWTNCEGASKTWIFRGVYSGTYKPLFSLFTEITCFRNDLLICLSSIFPPLFQRILYSRNHEKKLTQFWSYCSSAMGNFGNSSPCGNTLGNRRKCGTAFSKSDGRSGMKGLFFSQTDAKRYSRDVWRSCFSCLYHRCCCRSSSSYEWSLWFIWCEYSHKIFQNLNIFKRQNKAMPCYSYRFFRKEYPFWNDWDGRFKMSLVTPNAVFRSALWLSRKNCKSSIIILVLLVPVKKILFGQLL